MTNEEYGKIHVGLETAEKELQKMQGLENARKEMGLSARTITKYNAHLSLCLKRNNKSKIIF